MYKILLFYKYVTIDDPEAFRDKHKELCSSLNLKGRIIVAKEGINGTVEGTENDTTQYMHIMSADPRFANMHFKISEGTGNAFPKLSIKARDEIVALKLGDEDFDPNTTTGKYISAEEFHKLINSNEEFYIIDMRNDYEHDVGHFEGSILPKMRTFRELPQCLPEIEHLKNKKVVTVCTGGIRCEKASGYLVLKGFKDVSQLYGGIVTYMETYPNQDFLGQLYVFDGRVVMGFNTDSQEHTTIGRCEHCRVHTNNYINCTNDECHKHYICCEQCLGENESIPCASCVSVHVN
ncbi:MAG: rhodanese-related sulfurtransferase [Patescibacteria group bacterium]|uniref:tRNA uridine(34) hydroxylase n=1 Tax=candidate division WWE3 bacterium TaxID=2053526 RepID=A0A955EBH7_UNCKA|nr:rhodanese-related sulfurtransferase [candidate division WWE3 bacterium]